MLRARPAYRFCPAHTLSSADPDHAATAHIATLWKSHGATLRKLVRALAKTKQAAA